MSKTVTLVPTIGSIIVVRDGKQVSPPKGKPYAFTEEEAADIAAINPKAVRKPVNETAVAEDDDGDAEVTSVAQPADEPAPAPAAATGKGKGGKPAKPAPAQDDDDEL